MTGPVEEVCPIVGPMEIEVLTKRDPAATRFKKAEWKIADREHYGQDVNWNTKKHFYLVARADKKIIGTLEMEIALGVAFIDIVIVARAARRRGVARDLMVQAEAIAREKGCHKICLSTGKTWVANLLYISLRYQLVGEQRNHHLHHNFVEYSKLLD